MKVKSTTVRCPDCTGTGDKPYGYCPSCGGSGYIEERIYHPEGNSKAWDLSRDPTEVGLDTQDVLPPVSSGHRSPGKAQLDDTVYIGIDPGKHGGLAYLQHGRIECIRMPPTETDVWEWISNDLPNSSTPYHAIIEKVGGFMGASAGEQGDRNKASGHTMFIFGMGYGGLRMALIGNGIPFEEVMPSKWQRVMGISARKKGESKSSHKNRIKARAQQLFPSVKVTLATCDALLIAEYCRRQHTVGAKG